MMNHKQQLLPGFNFRLDADFSSFFVTKTSQLAKKTFEQGVREQRSDCLYLSGAQGVGKSHLLQAACNLANEEGRSAIYLPLAEFADFSPEVVLDGVQTMDLVALDDVQSIAHSAVWQEALFHLYNQRLLARRPIYFAANVPARLLCLSLPDLQSRLCACLAFVLVEMRDDEKVLWLQFLADQRGMSLNEPCANYILLHYGRSHQVLLDTLEKLDQASLVQKRKITIPFIKEQLAASDF